MLDALHQELVAHVLNFVGARERVAVLLTCRNSRDAVLASKSTLLVGCRPLKESAAVQGYGVRFARGMEDGLAPANLDDHGILLSDASRKNKRREVYLRSARGHIVTGSIKDMWIAGGGTASLARGSEMSVIDGTRWLGRNFVCGVRLDRLEVAGWTTLVGCLIVDGIKVEAGATLELLGCTIYTHYPQSLRVGKRATLVATDCCFRTVTPAEHEAARAPFTDCLKIHPQLARGQWVDSRKELVNGLHGQHPNYHVRAERCKGVTLRGCTLSPLGKTDKIQGVCLSVELGCGAEAMETLVVEDCDIRGSKSIMLVRGDMPCADAVSIRRNRLAGSVTNRLSNLGHAPADLQMDPTDPVSASCSARSLSTTSPAQCSH